MLASPCLDCSLKEKDKNNKTCRDCKKRLNYVRGLDRALEFTISPREESWYPLNLPEFY